VTLATPIMAYRMEQWILLLLLVALALLLQSSDALWRWDHGIYDMQMQLWQRQPSSQIIIVAIDDTSLQTLGRWPWSRRVHARMLQQLQQDAPRAVALDILFAQADQQDGQGDQLLVDALRAAGNVALPVMVEQTRAGGVLVEALPAAGLADAAAALGHVHVELDRDGIARRLFQYEGLGAAYWPHLMLALLRVGGQDHAMAPQQSATSDSMLLWHRAQPRMIPFAGPPGHFQQISYQQVLRGEFVPGTFRDKYVLVGTTAAGLGDALPTPLSAQQRPMPGVEINAHLLDAMLQDIELKPLNARLSLVLTALLAALPLLLFPQRSPRSNLLGSALLLVSCLLVSASLLWFAQSWFAPSAAMLAIALSYPLWSWRRLEYFMRYLGHQLDQLRAEHASLQRLGLAQTGVTPAQLTRVAEGSVANVSSPVLVEDDQSSACQRHDSLQERVELVRSAALEMRTLRDLLDAGLANMADGVILLNRSDSVMLSNAQAALYLLESEQQNLHGLRLTELFTRACADQASLPQLSADVRHQQALQVYVRTRAGRDLLLQRAPLRKGLLATDEQLSIINIADISALKASERRRNESLHFLSHDLRAPLVSMLALLEQARDANDGPPLDQLLEQMQRYTTGTLHMAEQFLQLARAEAAESLHLQQHDLVSIADQAADRLWASARQQQVRIICAHRVTQAWVLVDAGLLERAIINLLDNAIKHSPVGAEIMLVVASDDQQYHCEVIDQGPGIEAAALPRLFQRFRTAPTAHAEHAATGIGLGLAFVDTVVRRHHGHVEVDSTPGAGSLFRIVLPALITP